jgi:hypothetical protein
MGIRKHFSNPAVQYVGSTSGCGCDFPNVMFQNEGWPILETAEAERDEWDIARDVSERRNRESLFALLRSSGDERIEVYGIWLDDREELGKPPVAFEDISLDAILASDFRFKERLFYRVSATASLSIPASGPLIRR